MTQMSQLNNANSIILYFLVAETSDKTRFANSLSTKTNKLKINVNLKSW